MNSQRNWITLCCYVVCIAIAVSVMASSQASWQLYPTEPQTIRDLLCSLANFAKCSPMQRAALLGTPSVFMAGAGLPLDEALARQSHEHVAKTRTLVWEFTTDHGGHGAPWVYDKKLALLQKLIDDYPQPPLVGVLLDDMTSMSVSAGLKPEDIARLRESLPAGIKLFGVVYTMNMRQPGMDAIIKELDVINLWNWHAKDVVDLADNVAYCEEVAPDKPIILGLYLRDYGGGRLLRRREAHTP